MNLYFISGLGADERVYGRMHFEGHRSHFIKWITPKHCESLPDYAIRLAGQIDQEEDFALIGVSFGGMLAIEISEVLNPSATVLISSLPRFKPIGTIRQIFRFIPISGKILRASLPIFRGLAPFLFGVKDQEDKQFLKRIITETDPNFVSWAVSAIMSWKRSQLPDNILSIHGRSDLLIPAFLRSKSHKLPGGHFIVWQKAQEVEKIIKNHLDQLH